VVELLLRQGANPNAKDFSGRSVLHYAMINEHTDIEQTLRSHGAE
jgi:ankyrin repeat protein